VLLTQSMLTCGVEAWTVSRLDECKITVTEIKLMGRPAGCTHLDDKRKLDIMEELK
jgi:hypothetical protein